MDVMVNIQGFEPLAKLLHMLPDEIAEKALESGLRAGANIVKKAAQEKAPVYHGTVRTVKVRGRTRILTPYLLRQSIKVFRDRKTKDSLLLKIGPTGKAFYGMFLEFGTSKMAARPFLRPALDENQAKVIEAFGKGVGRAVENAAMKLAGLK